MSWPPHLTQLETAAVTVTYFSKKTRTADGERCTEPTHACNYRVRPGGGIPLFTSADCFHPHSHNTQREDSTDSVVSSQRTHRPLNMAEAEADVNKQRSHRAAPCAARVSDSLLWGSYVNCAAASQVSIGPRWLFTKLLFFA